jgi:hypothetical protein
MADLLEFRAVGKLAEYVGHALVRVREMKGFNQKQLREAINQWRLSQYGEQVKKVGSGTLSDAENGVSNFEIGTIEDALASIRATPMELIYQAFVVATYEQKGDPLPPVKRRRRGQSHEGQDAAPSNTAQAPTAGTFPVTENASDDEVEPQPYSSERIDMTDKSPQQRALLHFAQSLLDDDDAAVAHDAALKAVAARRSLHQGDASGSG